MAISANWRRLKGLGCWVRYRRIRIGCFRWGKKGGVLKWCGRVYERIMGSGWCEGKEGNMLREDGKGISMKIGKEIRSKRRERG